MAEQNGQVSIVDAVVASNVLYPGGDFMVADPPSGERQNEESDVGEGLLMESTSQEMSRPRYHGCTYAGG